MEHPHEQQQQTPQPETSNTIPVLEQLSIALGILLIIFGATYVPTVIGMLTEGLADVVSTTDENVTQGHSEHMDTDPFTGVQITARAAYVYDIRTGEVLFTQNANDVLPLASVTKIMTALVSYEILDTTDAVSISLAAVLQEGDSGLYSDEAFTLQDLSDMTLINSANDGAYALAAAAGAQLYARGDTAATFVEAMNIRADDLGLTRTHFKNPTGLDLSETESGAEGSARDMAYLMSYVVTERPEILEGTRIDATSIQNSAGETHLVANTNRAVNDIPNLLASKTGYTDLAGGNLVIAYDADLNRPIVISVLGSTYLGRFADIQTLVDATNQYLQYTE